MVHPAGAQNACQKGASREAAEKSAELSGNGKETGRPLILRGLYIARKNLHRPFAAQIQHYYEILTRVPPLNKFATTNGQVSEIQLHRVGRLPLPYGVRNRLTRTARY
jgi:hypothetical protein